MRASMKGDRAATLAARLAGGVPYDAPLPISEPPESVTDPRMPSGGAALDIDSQADTVAHVPLQMGQPQMDGSPIAVQSPELVEFVPESPPDEPDGMDVEAMVDVNDDEGAHQGGAQGGRAPLPQSALRIQPIARMIENQEYDLSWCE